MHSQRQSHSHFGKSMKLVEEKLHDDHYLAKLAYELDDYFLDDLYEIMVRNGFYLPQKSCHWLTKKVMISVAMGKIYCPMYKQIRPQPCPKPPQR